MKSEEETSSKDKDDNYWYSIKAFGFAILSIGFAVGYTDAGGQWPWSD